MPGAGHGRDTLSISQWLCCVSLSSRDVHSLKFKGQLTGVTPKGQPVELKNEVESSKSELILIDSHVKMKLYSRNKPGSLQRSLRVRDAVAV